MPVTDVWPPNAPPCMRERDFQKTVTEAARWHGWLCVHFPNARFNPCWPDLMLLRDGVIRFVELKTERGFLGKAQVQLRDDLAVAGFELEVIRPSDWDDFAATLPRSRAKP